MHQNIEVKFVLEGVETEVTVNANAALVAALEKLFHEREVTGRSPKEYVVSLEDGRKLELTRSLAEQGVSTGMVLFVNPEEGAGGE